MYAVFLCRWNNLYGQDSVSASSQARIVAWTVVKFSFEMYHRDHPLSRDGISTLASRLAYPSYMPLILLPAYSSRCKGRYHRNRPIRSWSGQSNSLHRLCPRRNISWFSMRQRWSRCQGWSTIKPALTMVGKFLRWTLRWISISIVPFVFRDHETLNNHLWQAKRCNVLLAALVKIS